MYNVTKTDGGARRDLREGGGDERWTQEKGGLELRRMLPVFALAVAWVCVLCSQGGATTSDTFRCPNGAIVSVNDKISTVRLRCDEPTSMTTRTVTRGLLNGYYETVEIEEWTYNQEPSRFVYCLRFENGVLARIESGGYGD